jgi:hypothetical protein
MSALLLLARVPPPRRQRLRTSRGDRLVKVELLADRPRSTPANRSPSACACRSSRLAHLLGEPRRQRLPDARAHHARRGFTSAPALYPGPEREVSEGDIVCYVYQRRVRSARLDVAGAGSAAPAASATFDVEASWLVCTEVCYPGSGTRGSRSRRGRRRRGPRSGERKAFADARARLPQPWSELPGASIEWSGSAEDPIALVSVPGATDLELSRSRARRPVSSSGRRRKVA